MTGGSMLREARLQAGLTQVQLAALAGVPQSMISAYENDRRDPTYSTLDRLLGATGHRLTFAPADASSAASSPTLLELRRKRRTIIGLLERNGAHRPRVFGSVARGDDHEGSDVDVMVDLDDDVGLVRLIGLERQLSDVIGRRVDLVPASSLKASVRAEAEAEAVAL